MKLEKKSKRNCTFHSTFSLSDYTMELDKEKGRLFEREKILANDTESMKVKLSTETFGLKDDELVFINHHSTTSKTLHCLISKCTRAVTVTIIAVLLFVTFSIFGIIVVVHVNTKESRSGKFGFTNNLEINPTSEVQVKASTALNLFDNVSMKNFANELKNSSVSFSSNKARFDATSITPSVKVASTVLGFNCFSPWFTRLSSCYMFSKDLKTWNEALASCKEKQGQLVQINDHAENDFWIGLSYQSKERGWLWNHDATSVISPQYTNWASGQPQTKLSDNDCIELSKRSLFLWSVANCHEKKRYVCEKHS